MKNNCIYSFLLDKTPRKDSRAFELGLKCVQKYASKINCDFILHTEKTVNVGKSYMAERLFAYTLLQEYERVLCLGLDIIIRDFAGNIFEDCPDINKVYILDERFHYSQHNESWNYYWTNILANHPEIRRPNLNVNSIPYYNADVVLCSYPNKILYENMNDWFDGILGDQDYVNYKIFKHNISIAPLPIKYNTITCHVETPACKPEYKAGMKDSAYFLHYSSPAEKFAMINEWDGKII